MSIRKNRTAVSLGVVTLVAAVAVASFTAGAGAQAARTPSALPRNATLYTSGTAWGPFTQLQPAPARTTPPACSGCCTRRCSATTRSRTGSSRGSRRAASGQGRSFVVTLRNGVTWNDGKPLTAADVKFTFETGKLEGSQFSTMWKTGLQSVTTSGNVGQVQLQGCPELPGLGHQHVLDPDRPEAHLVELQRDRDHDGQHRRRSSSAPGRSRTAPARAPRRRCSGTGATAGGRPRRSG